MCALAAAIFSEAGDLSRTEQHLQQLMSYLPHALHSSAADEVLYGRAGFLFCLLLVRKYVGKEQCERFGVDTAMRKVFDTIIKSGKDNSGAKPPNTRCVCVCGGGGVDGWEERERREGREREDRRERERIGKCLVGM